MYGVNTRSQDNWFYHSFYHYIYVGAPGRNRTYIARFEAENFIH